MTKSILVVEDDPDIRQYLNEFLRDNGFDVHTASDGQEAIDHFKNLLPDLVVLDLGLPVMSGEEVAVKIRERYDDLPIIILSAQDSTKSVLKGFNLGADDYVPKPFVADELLARIRARLKTQDSHGAILKVDDLELDGNGLEVKRADKKIQLTPQEFKLLEYLMANKGRILTREMILKKIWLYSTDVETRVVDVYIGYLRKKIDGAFSRKLIHSVRGFGYVIKINS
jgi:two-component system, OmpR family, response regulator MprA